MIIIKDLKLNLFIKNSLNSLSYFGRKIKEQLQNLKNTVIDSFKGCDSINNYNYYEENNIQKLNYNDNDDYNLGNNNINNENQNENEQ